GITSRVRRCAYMDCLHRFATPLLISNHRRSLAMPALHKFTRQIYHLTFQEFESLTGGRGIIHETTLEAFARCFVCFHLHSFVVGTARRDDSGPARTG